MSSKGHFLTPVNVLNDGHHLSLPYQGYFLFSIGIHIAASSGLEILSLNFCDSKGCMGVNLIVGPLVNSITLVKDLGRTVFPSDLDRGTRESNVLGTGSFQQLYLLLSMLVCEYDDGRMGGSTTDEKDTVSLLCSTIIHIKRSEDVFDPSKCKNSYAMSELGLSIIKRLAPKKDDHQVSSTSVILPLVLYKKHDKKEDNELLVGEEKTWLTTDNLAQFDSLELEANGIHQVDSVLGEDDIMMDSETEGSEIPLAKLMKLLKAKSRKVLDNEAASTVIAKDSDFDIFKMVRK